jgi:hypothetical protein
MLRINSDMTEVKPQIEKLKERQEQFNSSYFKSIKEFLVEEKQRFTAYPLESDFQF